MKEYLKKLRTRVIGGSFHEINDRISELSITNNKAKIEIEALRAQNTELKKEFVDTIKEIEKLNRDFAQHRQDKNDDHWFLRNGFDRMIAKLQLAAIEQKVPGNQERLASLKDTHKGERCFIIGNGPSLTAADLDVLHDNNVFTFASNRIGVIFPETLWRPNVWSVADILIFDNYREEGTNHKNSILLLSSEALLEQNILHDNAIYYPYIHIKRTPCSFSADIMKGVHEFGTVTGQLINFAVYMGFSEIYLLGVDNMRPTKVNDSGRTIIDTTRPWHFSKDYHINGAINTNTGHIIAEPLPDHEVFARSEISAQTFKALDYYASKCGVKIYNATRGGALEVLERISFEKALGIN